MTAAAVTQPVNGADGPVFHGAAAGAVWRTARFDIALDTPRIMGIVNATPDSFSDGGQHADTASALRHAERLLQDGAHILDVGGESSRPGSTPLPEAEERARVLPLLRELAGWNVPLSIDSYKPAVMQAALDAGCDIVNDIWALRWSGAAGEAVVAAHPRCGVCLMHMHRDPQSMQAEPMAGDAVPQVAAFLAQRAAALRKRGVEPARIVLDPGIGFGKTPAQNFALLARQRDLLAGGYALLAGWSRKSSLGAATGRAVGDRIAASVAAALLAVQHGARIVRVHDVAATADALAVWSAVQTQTTPPASDNPAV